MPFNILHLSDLHIGRKSINYEHLIDSIQFSFDSDKKQINSIVVTGDIFDGKIFNQSENDRIIKQGVKFFENLLEKINKEKNGNLTKEDILFVPGNHEINRNAAKDKSFEKYINFLTSFYGETKNYDLKKLSVFKEINGEKLIIAGLNSANYDKQKGCKQFDENKCTCSEREKCLLLKGNDYGCLELTHYTGLARILQDEKYSSHRVIILLHHHFYLVEERDKSILDESSLRNSESFLNVLSKCNVIAILHGHKHKNAVHRININKNPNFKDKMVNIVACGSTSHGEVKENNFNIVTIFNEDSKIEVEVLEYVKCQHQTFECSNKYSLPAYTIDDLSKTFIEILHKKNNLYDIYKKISKCGVSSNYYFKLIETILKKNPHLFSRLKKCKELILYIFLVSHIRVDKKENLNKILEIIPEKLKTSFFSELCKINNIYELRDFCKKQLDNYSKYNRENKENIIFMIISYFITDISFTLKKNIDEFFSIKLNNECNFNAAGNELIDGIENNINIVYTEDKRAIEIDIECSKAISHKAVKLVINEYELILSDFEKIFSEVGFKLYYITVSIHGTKNKDDYLESYIFNAYTPTLLGLFGGKHIYDNNMVFIRELIQNSIDAIHFRKLVDKNFKTNEEIIDITTTNDSNNQITLSINDNGVGMSKYHIERYLTTLGRSFYKSEEFERAISGNIYPPISQFGIGFLSCFNVSTFINIVTKYWDISNDINTYKLEIPNIDGCFFIETIESKDIGTTITLNKIDNEININLENYICRTFEDCKYNINLNENTIVRKGQFDKDLREKTNKFNLYFCIILDKDGNVLEDDGVDDTYKIYFYKENHSIYKNAKVKCLCNGIAVKKYDTSLVEKKLFPLVKNYFDVILNLSSKCLELEVSRDTAKSLNIDIESINKKFHEKLINHYDSGYLKKLPALLIYFQFTELFVNSDFSLLFENESMNITPFLNNSDIVNKMCSRKQFFLKLIYNFFRDKIICNTDFERNFHSATIESRRDFIRKGGNGEYLIKDIIIKSIPPLTPLNTSKLSTDSLVNNIYDLFYDNSTLSNIFSGLKDKFIYKKCNLMSFKDSFFKFSDMLNKEIIIFQDSTCLEDGACREIFIFNFILFLSLKYKIEQNRDFKDKNFRYGFYCHSVFLLSSIIEYKMFEDRQNVFSDKYVKHIKNEFSI